MTALKEDSKNLRKYYGKMDSSGDISAEDFTNIVLDIKKAVLDQVGAKPDTKQRYSENFFEIAATLTDKHIAPTILFIGACYLFDDKNKELIAHRLKKLPIYKNKDKQFLLDSQWLKMENYDAKQIAEIKEPFLNLPDIFKFYFLQEYQKQLITDKGTVNKEEEENEKVTKEEEKEEAIAEKVESEKATEEKVIHDKAMHMSFKKIIENFDFKQLIPGQKDQTDVMKFYEALKEKIPTLNSDIFDKKMDGLGI